MEQTTHSTHGATQEANGVNEGMTEAEFEQKRQDGIAYETHRKALAQRAKFKEDNDTLRAELDSYKQREMESQGKFQELVESQRKRIAELEERNKKMSSQYQWNVVGAQIKSELSTRGVRNADKALKYAIAAHKDDLNTIEVDDQYNVNSEDLGRFVDKFLSDNVDMGWVNKVNVKDLTPGGDKSGNNEPKSISKLSDDEIMEAWKHAQD